VNYAVGDIHGSLEKLLALLERQGLINRDHHWAAEDTHLILLGDYLDRGEDGIGVLETIMRLEVEAPKSGGKVTAVLGNHDLILLEVHAFGDAFSPGFLRQGTEMSFRRMWLENAGGQMRDLERLELVHVEWLEQRPALLKIDDTLLMHADSEFYLDYGNSVDSINKNIRSILQTRDMIVMDQLEERFSSRMAFMREPEHVAQEFAARFGANKIVHGHTPIYKLRNIKPQDVTIPLEYANGVCVNLDHGLCYGGNGFVYEL
jgi:Calcineurin-like phosphoesterase